MNYIYYQTKTKFINTGDALINKALLDTLREYGKLQCNCSKEIPDFFINELGIKNDEKIYANSELKFVLTILKRAITKKKENKIYIFSGLGHNFGGSPKKIIRNLITGLIIFPIYRLFGVRITRIGMSIGPITKALGISERIRSWTINYYLVRDEKSLKLCHEIGIKKAKLCPDLSWLYLKNKKREISLDKDNSIIICLRDSMFDTEDITYREKLLNKLDELLKKMNEKEKIKLLFMYQVEEDKDFTFELYNRYSSIYDCKLEEKQIRLSNAKKYYSNYKFNISNRMHSILFGYKYGSMPIVLTDLKRHTKISQTLVDNDIEEIAFDINAESNNKLDNLYIDYTDIMKKIYKVEKNNQEKIIEELNDILKK